MRVLALYYTHKPGGFCKRLYRLLNALCARGAEVHFLSLDEAPLGKDSKIIFHKIPFPLTTRRGLFFWGLFTLWIPLYALWKSIRLKPERWVLFGAYYATATLLARRLLKTPGVLFLRSLVFKIDRINKKPAALRFFTEFVERLGVRSAEKVVLMTQSMQQELEEFLGHKIKVSAILPNDVPPQAKAPPTLPNETALRTQLSKAENYSLRVLTSGVLDQRKNLDFLFDVFAVLQNENICLLVAGEGPQTTELKARLTKDNIQNIFMLGWLENVSALYPGISLVMHASSHEGMPNSVMEALAYKLPVLVADIPELRELMSHAELLFDLGDWASCAQKLRSLLRDLESLEFLAELCAERSNIYTFDWDEAAAKIVLA